MEISSRSLRIGNLVYNKNTNTSGLPDGVVRITGNGIHRIDDGVLHFWGIPLTSEWLLKFGFELTDIKWIDDSVSKDVYRKDGYYIDLKMDAKMICKIDDNYPGYRNIYIRSVEYVDQIQNVYYFLTGEELTIKE